MVKVSDVSKHLKLLFTSPVTPLSAMLSPSVKPMSIFMIEAALYEMLSKRCDHYCFTLFMQEIDKVLKEKKEVNSKTVLDSEY